MECVNDALLTAPAAHYNNPPIGVAKAQLDHCRHLVLNAGSCKHPAYHLEDFKIGSQNLNLPAAADLIPVSPQSPSCRTFIQHNNNLELGSHTCYRVAQRQLASPGQLGGSHT